MSNCNVFHTGNEVPTTILHKQMNHTAAAGTVRKQNRGRYISIFQNLAKTSCTALEFNSSCWEVNSCLVTSDLQYANKQGYKNQGTVSRQKYSINMSNE